MSRSLLLGAASWKSERRNHNQLRNRRSKQTMQTAVDDETATILTTTCLMLKRQTPSTGTGDRATTWWMKASVGDHASDQTRAQSLLSHFQPLAMPKKATRTRTSQSTSENVASRLADTTRLAQKIATTSAGDEGVCPTSMKMRIDTVLVRDGTTTIEGKTTDTGLREIDTAMMAVLAAMTEGLEAELTVITNPLSSSREEAL